MIGTITINPFALGEIASIPKGSVYRELHRFVIPGSQPERFVQEWSSENIVEESISIEIVEIYQENGSGSPLLPSMVGYRDEEDRLLMIHVDYWVCLANKKRP